MEKRTGCTGCPAFHDPCMWQGSGSKTAHIIVVGTSPSGFSIGAEKAFTGTNGRLFKGLLAKAAGCAVTDAKFPVQVYYTYCVLAGATTLTSEHVQRCRGNLLRDIENIRGATNTSPVILTLGPTPLKSLNIKAAKITDVVGRVMKTSLPTPNGNKEFTVIPLLSMEHVVTKPGTASVVIAGIRQAIEIATTPVSAPQSLDDITKNYEFPETIEAVEELVERIVKFTGNAQSWENWPISIDTETNTLYPYAHKDPRILMLSCAWAPGQAATILLDHPETPYDKKAAWVHVEKLLRCPKPKVFHNYKFDKKFIENVQGIKINNVVWDTMLGEHFLDEDKKGLYSLKRLTPLYASASVYTGYDDELHKLLRGDEDVPELDKPETDEATDDVEVPAVKKKTPSKNKKKSKGFEDVPLGTILKYAAVDADVTRIVMQAQFNRLRDSNVTDNGMSVMRNLYMPASVTLADMEFRGFKIDTAYLEQLEKDVTARVAVAKEVMSRKFGATLNLNAPGQLAAAMNELNFDAIPGVDTATTGKEVLGQYLRMYPPTDNRYIFADNLLDYRESSKVLSTYIKSLRKNMREGKVNCTFHLSGTSSGRLSSSNINMQNQIHIAARKVRTVSGVDEVQHPGFNIKKLFVPETKGNCIVNVDIKAAELRVYTAYAKDESMAQAIRDGLDVHSFVASKVYSIPYEEILARKDTDPEIEKKRLYVKRVVFGTLYGAGPYTISKQINVTIEEAEQLQQFLFNAFPALRQYIAGVTDEVMTRRYVDTFFGRRRRFPLASMGGRYQGDAIREAVNFKIQSTSSDLVLKQLCEIDQNIHEIDGKLLITVHDSIVIEMPPSNLPKLKPFLDKWIVQRIKEKYYWLTVPFLYDVEAGWNYGELTKLSKFEEQLKAASAGKEE